ncbi:MAG: hypothetical protein CYPHOPRED_006110 [Cyphobasidiales sp. Tagirdzhanova-0007]|nr:MAG: hypothetical protein CYPHOPRED_006110 [Cyphobasidiales sp. Tagirdzhanova-0007]
MDGSSRYVAAGRKPKRGRGGANTGGRSIVSRSSSTGNGSLNRKLAGTPLFRPQTISDGDESSDVDEAGKSTREEIPVDAEAARKSRFQNSASANRYVELKPLREKERRDAIAAGLIPDPLKPRRLDDAITFRGTCMRMCPEFEREEREYQKNVDKWELTPDSHRIDPRRAVKAFHRPAAGNEQPVPSDVRPPDVLRETLDYLFHDILTQDPGLADSHPFLRDRTRAIRQDFTMQNERGTIAIECHERIARYHILCLHALREWENFSENQELEQLRKVLQSLDEFYDDARHEGMHCPNEAEFRAYYLITHLRDSDTLRQIELLPSEVFSSEHLQAALKLQALAQRNNTSRGERGRRPANSEASLNAFSRFFKAVAGDETSYLLACLAESHFIDIRRGALVSLRKAYIPQHAQYPISRLTKMLGCDNIDHCQEVVEAFGLSVAQDTNGVPRSVELHRKVEITEYPLTIKQRISRRIVEAKRSGASFQSVIDGDFYSAHTEQLTRWPVSTHQSQKFPLASRPPATPAFPHSKLIPSPPASAPGTPAIASMAGSKPLQSLHATKLNATASAFTYPASMTQKPLIEGGASGKKQSPLASSYQEHQSLPLAQHPVSTPMPDSPTFRNPLQPRLVSPVIQTTAPRRKVSGRHPSTSTTLTVSQVRKQAAITGPSRGAIEQALPKLLGILLDEYSETVTRKTVTDSIYAVRLEQQAERDAERQLAVEQCSAELVDLLIEHFGAESARELVAWHLERRNALKMRMKQWRRRLVRVNDARKAHEERKQRFTLLARELSVKPHMVVSEQSTLELPDISVLELEDNAVFEEDDPLEKMKLDGFLRGSPSKNERLERTFWRPKTLSHLITSRINHSFSSLRSAEMPDWKMIVVLSSLDSPIAAWYRCKLGMGKSEDGSIIIRPRLRIEFTLVLETALQEQNLEQVGLMIVNVESAHAPPTWLPMLEEELVRYCRYETCLVQANWSEGLEKVTSGFVQHLIKTDDADGGLGNLLGDLLQDFSALRATPLTNTSNPLSDILQPFIEAWQAALERSLSQAYRVDIKSLIYLSRQFLSLLRDIDLVTSPYFSSKEEQALTLPALAEDTTVESVSDVLQDYLAHKDLANNLSLSYCGVVIRQMNGSDSSLIRVFFQYVSDALLTSFEPMHLDWGCSMSDLKAVLEDYLESLEGKVSAVSEIVRQQNSHAWKKRRRTSSVDVQAMLHENECSGMAAGPSRLPFDFDQSDEGDIR